MFKTHWTFAAEKESASSGAQWERRL